MLVSTVMFLQGSSKEKSALLNNNDLDATFVVRKGIVDVWNFLRDNQNYPCCPRRKNFYIQSSLKQILASLANLSASVPG